MVWAGVGEAGVRPRGLSPEEPRATANSRWDAKRAQQREESLCNMEYRIRDQEHQRQALSLPHFAEAGESCKGEEGGAGCMQKRAEDLQWNLHAPHGLQPAQCFTAPTTASRMLIVEIEAGDGTSGASGKCNPCNA